ncbi:hypothetical protein D3M70_08875 [Pseudomonas sp. LS-2]|nr:hypothetical protein D3M70_08875 [Pseudomonas sp. LS-2]
MNAKEFASQLLETVKEIKSNKNESIQCDNLIQYLDNCVRTSPADLSQDQIEHLKAQLQIMVEREKSNHASDLEMFRSVIQSGQNALKTALLMNGGASVALLAFIGKLTEERQAHIPAFTNALAIFVLGVFCIVVASGSTYLSQWLYADEPEWKERAGFWFNALSILLGLTSYGLFIWAMTKAYSAFMTFG